MASGGLVDRGARGWTRGLLVAAYVAIGRPGLWAAALAAFLVRGGIVPFALPIVVVPSVTGLANVFGEDVAALALGGPGPGTIRLVVAVVAGALAWLLGGGLLAAVLEVAAIRDAAGDEELAAFVGAGANDAGGPAPAMTAPDAPGRLVRLGVRVLVVRLLALVPLALVLMATVPLIVGAAYHELILPADLVTPIALRVATDVPGSLLAIGLAWLAGETVGSVAARLVVLHDRSPVAALLRAAALLLTGPLAAAAIAAAGLLAMVLAIAPALVASSAVWTELRVALAGGADLVLALAGTILLVGAWAGGLVLAAAAGAWRSAAWTVEVLRPRTAPTSLVQRVRERAAAGRA